MDLQKAIKLLEQEYERAQKMCFVRNPLAWALYRVWKKADGQKDWDEDCIRDCKNCWKTKLANSQWIPVTERLPEIPEGWAESPERVLYMMKNTQTIYAGYYGEGGLWRDKYFRQYADSRNGVDADDVFCWMYQHDLPQPPKGE